ncbi:MAG TPA: sigma-70 family RNA polymerase sigma factor [Hanamia sp.]|nr:sigma-70 family RNA polymerase sigma factor [Hanamia sp.]
MIHEELGYHIHRCLSNDRDSQKYIYESFYDYTRSFCICYAADEDESIAILNNIFLKVFKHIHQFSSGGDYELSFKTWMRKWIISGIVDHCRAHFKHELLLDFKHETLTDMQDAWQRFFRMLCPRQQHPSFHDIMKMIRSLSPASRIILNLSVLEDFDEQQIADCLNTSPETARTNLLKAKRQLQNKLFCLSVYAENIFQN